MLTDAVCMAVVWFVVVCGYWAVGLGRYSPSDYLEFWPWLLIFVAGNAVVGLYHGNWMYPAAPLPPVEELRRFFGTALLTHVGILAFLGFAYQTTEGYSRLVIGTSGFLVAISAQSFRNWMRALLKKLDVGQVPVMLAGDGETAEGVERQLADDPYTGFKIVARVDDPRRIVDEARRLDVKILLVCLDSRLFRLLLDDFSGWFNYIEYLPTIEAFPVFGARAVSFGGIGGVEMVNHARMKVKRFQKRLLDTALSGLIFLISVPLFVIIPILIRLTSRGPVFYRAGRLGKGGRRIEVWKFRSMYVDADMRLKSLLASDPTLAEEFEERFKLKDDPRITPFGRFLRKTSLDELPQLFNVFGGSMALVGPRPIVDAEVKYYGSEYKVVFSVKPGITGLWQVSGRSDTDYRRRVALDAYYVQNWSPWMDIWILIRTTFAVVLMRGAR